MSIVVNGWPPAAQAEVVGEHWVVSPCPYCGGKHSHAAPPGIALDGGIAVPMPALCPPGTPEAEHGYLVMLRERLVPARVVLAPAPRATLVRRGNWRGLEERGGEKPGSKP